MGPNSTVVVALEASPWATGHALSGTGQWGQQSCPAEDM